jgi:hypothetical protein
VSVIKVYIKQIFKSEEKAPLLHSPQSAVPGVGQYWLFSARSHEFGHGFKAVRITLFCGYSHIICLFSNLWWKLAKI